MHQKTLKIVAIIVVLCIVGMAIFFLLNNRMSGNDEEINQVQINKNSNGKILVIYFSATNNTKNVAKKIANNLNADIFEIIPEDEYTSADLNWTNDNSRVSKEHEDESLRNVQLKNTKVENWETYDIVIIGYPIWWGVAAWPVNTFVQSNDFSGKTVIPFCTSASSSLGQSGELLAKLANSGNWLEGYRFSSHPSDDDIKAFTGKIQ